MEPCFGWVPARQWGAPRRGNHRQFFSGFSPLVGFVVIVDLGWQGDRCGPWVVRGPRLFRSRARKQKVHPALLDR